MRAPGTRMIVALWMNDMESVISELRDLPGVQARVVYPQPNGREVPHAWITIDSKLTGLNANAVIRALQFSQPGVTTPPAEFRIREAIPMPSAAARRNSCRIHA